MRNILLVAGVTAIGLPAIPVIHYRTLSPCEMLQLELVDRVRQDVAKARADAQDEVRKHGATAESVAVAVGDVVSAVSVMADPAPRARRTVVSNRDGWP